MILNKQQKLEKRLNRKARIRRKVSGTSEHPRLTVYKSAQHTYVQVIDDTKGATLVAASTIEKDLREELGKMKKVAAAAKIGELVAERCQAKNIKAVVFDRNGYAYHGRIAKLAEAARQKGLSF